MRRVNPKVYCVGETSVNMDSVRAYLEEIGTEWIENSDTSVSGGEFLSEVFGRMCYRSWEPGMNPNVTRIREGNNQYIKNIINSRHGSVLEHATTNWIFSNVSRVFTAELIRHRAGTAFSEESHRYVRLTNLGLWLPDAIKNDPYIIRIFEDTFKSLEDLQVELANVLSLDEEDKSFKYKKEMTSLIRRVAPHGLATTIGVSFNHRALRHIIELRTSSSSESEMRTVFRDVGKICKDRWPSIYQDFILNEKEEWVTQNSKI